MYRPTQEGSDVAEKPPDAVVKFDTYRNLQQHRSRTVLPAIARHFVLFCGACFMIIPILYYSLSAKLFR